MLRGRAENESYTDGAPHFFVVMRSGEDLGSRSALDANPPVDTLIVHEPD
jgi:hypothetical protein